MKSLFSMLTADLDRASSACLGKRLVCILRQGLPGVRRWAWLLLMLAVLPQLHAQYCVPALTQYQNQDSARHLTHYFQFNVGDGTVPASSISYTLATTVTTITFSESNPTAGFTETYFDGMTNGVPANMNQGCDTTKPDPTGNEFLKWGVTGGCTYIANNGANPGDPCYSAYLSSQCLQIVNGKIGFYSDPNLPVVTPGQSIQISVGSLFWPGTGIECYYTMVSVTTPTNTTISINANGTNGSGSIALQYTNSYQLSGTLTTTNLIDEVRSDLTAQPITANWIDGMGQAYMQVSESGACVSGQSLVYRFVLPQTDAEQVYLVKFHELNSLPDGSVASRGKRELIAGTGAAAYGNPHQALLPATSPGLDNRNSVSVNIDSVTLVVGDKSSPGTIHGGSGGGAVPRSLLGGGPSFAQADGGFDLGGGANLGGCFSCGAVGVGAFTGDMGGGASGGSGLNISLRLGSAGARRPGQMINLSASLLDAGAVLPENWDYAYSAGTDSTGRNSPATLQVGNDAQLTPHFGLLNWASRQSQVAFAYAAAPQSFTNIIPSQTAPVLNGNHSVSFSALGATQPFVSWNVVPGKNQTLVTKTFADGSIGDTYLYQFTGNSVALNINNGQRVERVVYSTQWNLQLQRSEISTIEDAVGNVLYQVTRIYQKFTSWSGDFLPEALVSETVGLGPSARTTTYQYDANAAWVNGSLLPLQLVIHPDHSWEYYQYQAQYYCNHGAGPPVNLLTDVYSGLGDTPPPTNGNPPDATQCRHVNYDYTSADWVQDNSADPGGGGSDTLEPFTARTITEYCREIPIAQHYSILRAQQTIEIESLNPGGSGPAGLGKTGFLYTITTRDDLNRPLSVLHPDGTLSTYAYDNVPGAANYTVTEAQGQTNSQQPPTVNDGERTVLVRNAADQVQTFQTMDIASGQITRTESYGSPDAFLRFQSVTFLDGTTERRSFDCCGLESWTDRDGVITSYIPDGLHRLRQATRLGVSIIRGLDAAGNERQLSRQSVAGTTSLQSATYDLGGQPIALLNALNGPTTIQDYLIGGRRVRTTTHPDGGTRVETYYLDGSLKSLTGTAVFPRAFLNDTGSLDGLTLVGSTETQLDNTGRPSGQFVRRFRDALGRPYKTVYPDGTFDAWSYNALGQLTGTTDGDGVTTYYFYNGRGEREFTVLAALGTGSSNSDTPNLAGADRIWQVDNDVYTGSRGPVRRTRTFIYDTVNSAHPVLTSDTEVSLNGLDTWTTRFGLAEHRSVAYSGTGLRTETITAADQSITILQYQNGRLQSSTRQDAHGQPIQQLTYAYDPVGRVMTVTDARTGATSYTYNNADQILTQTTPAPGPNQLPQTYTHGYDLVGREATSTLPDRSVINRTFYPNGKLQLAYGSQTFPVQYGYDAQGRMTRMTTWTNFASSAGAAITQWVFNDPAGRGLLSQKIYADNTSTTYTYTSGGRLQTRAWMRGITTTYGYNFTGDLWTTAYSDGTTPTTTYTYDRQGRLSTVTRGAGTETLTYNDAGEVLSEAYAGGSLDGLSVTHGYDTLLRRQSLALQPASGPPPVATSYTYDAASRFQTITSGSEGATYTYWPNSSLVRQIVLSEGASSRLSRYQVYDNLNRLESVVSTPAAGAGVSVGYGYNQLNQRQSATLADGSQWNYAYDSKGEVISGAKAWSDGTPVAGEQFQYTFDDIGNRTSTQAGGDQYGQNLRFASYAANSVNEYTSRTVPGAVDIQGGAAAAATVTVDAQSAYRHGNFYRAQLPVNNSTGPVSVAVTTTAVEHQGGVLPDLLATTGGHYFLPQSPEVYTYDLDGNLLTDGRWRYTWDGENHLVSLQPLSVAAGNQTLNFEYDSVGRRIRKTVRTNNGSSSAITADTKFVYDGWNLIAELNAADNSVLRSYVWGPDLSGTLQGAGGVGGLLVARPGAGMAAQFACYDGNGNITAYVDAGTGQAVNQFEYGPFGEPLRVDTTAMRFGFSSKYTDPETGLVYYGYRYYNPQTRRWIGRDPIEENGGPNLYAFVANSSISYVDLLGLGISSLDSSIEQAIQQASVSGDTSALQALLDDNIMNAQQQSLIRDALRKFAARANKLCHIFEKARHNLGPLVERLGGQISVYNAVLKTVQAQKLADGVYLTTVTVGGISVTVGGLVADGVANIATFFIKGAP